jgi:hypothetical protein
MAKNQKSAPEPQHPAALVPDLDLIDLGGALPTKPHRGRPRTATPKLPKDPNRKVRKDKGIKKGTKNQGIPYIDNNRLVDDNINKEGVIGLIGNKEVHSATDLKSIITEKEARFLQLYVTGEYTIEKAMIAAGYEGYSQRGLYYIASKICNKVESQTDDHRKLFREMGAGEMLVIKTLVSLIKTSKNELIKLNATSQLAKILGLTKEQLEGAGGITLIFESAEGARVQVVGPGAPPLPATPAALPGPTSKKPMMITK